MPNFVADVMDDLGGAEAVEKENVYSVAEFLTEVSDFPIAAAGVGSAGGIRRSVLPRLWRQRRFEGGSGVAS